MVDWELDAKGLVCPLPVLKARKAMKQLEIGERLRIEATDPGSVQDMDSFCASQGHKLIESGEYEGVFTFVVQKAEKPA